MVKFDALGGLKEPDRDVKVINKVETGNAELDGIIHQYKATFEGIGKARRNGKDIEVHLPLKENVQPIAQKPQRVPYNLMDPLKKRINEFVESEIMEKVPEHDSITWCSPLVVQPKAKNASDI